MTPPPGGESNFSIRRVFYFDGNVIIFSEMRKLLGLLTVSSLLFSFVFLGNHLVASAKEKSEIPEQDGTYNDPDHPGIKVRVFVHREKPGRPTPPPPSLVCNLSDPDSTSLVSSEAWKLPSTWIYNLNFTSVPSSVGGNNLPQIAKDGFDAWKKPTGIVFIRGNDTLISTQKLDYLNIITWGRISASALGITYIRYNSSGLVVDVDTILNSRYVWTWSNSNTCAYEGTCDAENILTHELGHWVGLDDEYTSDFVDNTMYGYGAKGEVKKDTPTTGDIQAASGIYR